MTASTSTDEQRALRWARVRACLGEGLELEDEARTTFLQGLRRADAALADEVAELLALGDDSGDFLAGPPRSWVEELLETPPAFDLAGRRVGAYRIVRRIGSGGMGEVYLGERADGSYEMQVAVKLMRDALPADADVSRFARERQILASLSHVNLAKILDGGVTDTGMPYFVMELVDGVPLDEYCATHQSTLAQRLALMHTICQVVHYVNQRGVVHRDLKPRNILVTAAGVVKLLDFGIATRLDDGREACAGGERTQTGLRKMTLQYASPEQVRGDPVGPASDVYALGAVMFNLLTGAQPYPIDAARLSGFELARAICDVEPRRMSACVVGTQARALRQSLRGDLDAIVATALRKEPAARYASAEALADDLFRHQATLPVRARQGALSYRAGRWLFKHRVLAGATIVVNLALLAGLGAALQQAHEAGLQRARAQRNFDSVRTLANVFLFDFYDAVSSLPGSMDARRLIADKAQVYLQALSHDAAADPALTLELAVSYRKIGDIQGLSPMPNLGDFAGALGNYEQSITLLRPLAEAGAPAQRARVRVELARSLSRKANVLYEQERFAPAEEVQHQVQALLDVQLREHPDDPAALIGRAGTLGALAWLRLRQGDAVGYDRYETACMAQLQQILAARPQDSVVALQLGSAYSRRAQYFLERDVRPESARLALEPLQAWIALAQGLHERQPDHPLFTGAMAQASNTLARTLQRLGRHDEAMAAVNRCIALLERELRLDPGDQNAHELMMDARTTLASLQLDQGDPTRARAAAAQGLADYAAMSQAAQANSRNARTAAQAHYFMALALQASARTAPPGLHPQSCRELQASLRLLQGPGKGPSSLVSPSPADVERAVLACR